MSRILLTPAATAQQREVLAQALADAIHYRDTPAACPACPAPGQLCGECAATRARSLAYLELSQVFGMEPPLSGSPRLA